MGFPEIANMRPPRESLKRLKGLVFRRNIASI
jgi:hypothetical protein